MDVVSGIAPSEAIDIVRRERPSLGDERVALDDALGRVLAEDLASRCDHPGVDNSALDGYACRVKDTEGASTAAPVRLRLVGEAPAGRPYQGRVGPGEAVRIFTGAAVPDGADGIVPVEASREPDEAAAVVELLQPARASDIRRRAQDLEDGRVYLARGRRLDAAALGLAAGMGHGTVPVVRRPRVALLTTGDEVVDPGRPLERGQVYDSNGASLMALGRAAGAEMVRLPRVGDDAAALEEALGRAGRVDLLLTSGGVSMGRYDLVRDLLFDKGAVHFWKVAMKPGGPALFGRLGDLPVLGLPGNPVSSMVVFLVLGRSFLDAALGRNDPLPYRDRRQARASTRFAAASAKESLPRARLSRDDAGLHAAALPNQSSGVLRSMTEADALAVVPPGTDVAVGDLVDVIPLAGHLR
ncbi:MAG: molybdopterin molybdotransferase MoeA [Deinococcales bacterium]